MCSLPSILQIDPLESREYGWRQYFTTLIVLVIVISDYYIPVTNHLQTKGPNSVHPLYIYTVDTPNYAVELQRTNTSSF